jgi:2-polyprenyl-6-methoxyphenol hydroxylase-like FAD-dependent oxidoreductase
VLANGLNVGLRRTFGIERRIVSACHSISIGFNLVPVGRPAFDFPALTYFSERPSDRQPGIVLVGDAFETTCPVSGTGTDKVFTDVERLCNVHIPAWLATAGMGTEKIAAFYDDPVKQACDAWSSAKAYDFRSVSIDNGLYWRAQRWARFIAWSGEGILRRLRNRLSAEPEFRAQSSSSSSLSRSA